VGGWEGNRGCMGWCDCGEERVVRGRGGRGRGVVGG